MTHRHRVVSREIGQVRIYMTPRERRHKTGLKGFMSKIPFYQRLSVPPRPMASLTPRPTTPITVTPATAVSSPTARRYRNQNLNLCVELIDQRDKLETFCRKHGDLLQGRVIVYKHMEHWDLHVTRWKRPTLRWKNSRAKRNTISPVRGFSTTRFKVALFHVAKG